MFVFWVCEEVHSASSFFFSFSSLFVSHLLRRTSSSYFQHIASLVFLFYGVLQPVRPFRLGFALFSFDIAFLDLVFHLSRLPRFSSPRSFLFEAAFIYPINFNISFARPSRGLILSICNSCRFHLVFLCIPLFAMLSLSYFRSLVLLGFLAYAQAAVQFLGVAMAGGDFGCDIDGSCPLSTATLPLTELGHADGGGQMKHFVEDDGVNVFRLPTSWQFLINNDKEVSDTFDPTNAGRYDQFMKACLATGAYCMIDVHNFARFNGGIVGQGGPSDDMFVAIWAALAKMYADEPKVVFEITNEPHDLDLKTWAATCQKVVNGIRNAGAKRQMILLPGTNFDSAATLISTGSADALLAITNPDGSTDGLYLDIHKYLDNNNSGQNGECTTNNIGNFTMLATYLRQKKRQGLISETGASSEPSCMTDFCAQNAFINENDDVYIGYVSWAAGQFDETYVLSLTPTLQPDGSYKDNTLFSECVLAPYQKAGGAKGKALPSNTAAQPSSASKTTQTKASTSSKPSATAATSPSSSNSDTGSDAGAKGGSLAATTTTSASTSASTNAASVGRAVHVVKNLAVAAVVGAALL